MDNLFSKIAGAILFLGGIVLSMVMVYDLGANKQVQWLLFGLAGVVLGMKIRKDGVD